MTSDDWRVTVKLHPEDVGGFRRDLHEAEVEDEARERLGGRVIVGGGEDEGVVFLYADTREAAREAETVAREILRTHGLEAEFAIHRWHPVEERWEDEDVPLPRSDAELRAERERLDADETAQSEQLGVALWEVRIELASHDDAAELADRLEGSYSVVRRWKYVLVGADNEDQAKDFAAQLERELPAGATIHVEPSGALVSQRVSPFAVLGGLGS